MEILAVSILVIFCVTGFVAIFFTTFGTLIILVGSAIYALLTGFSVLTPRTLVIMLLLYICGEIVEYIFVMAGAKKLGASNAAVAGALAGGIIGAAIGAGFFGFGIIIGTFIGIFLGAFLVELVIHRSILKSLKAGTGGVLGRIGSICAKVIIAILMFAVMISRMVI